MRGVLLGLAVSLATIVRGQEPGPPAAPAPPSAASSIDQLGALVKDGRLRVEADLLAGSVPAIPKYALEVRGAPKTSIAAEAADGRVTRMRFAVENGQLIVRGKGLRPKVSIESLEFESPRGVTGMTFHGLGIWKPIVAIFGGIARSAVRKMEFRTDIPSVLKGEIMGGARPPTPSGPPTPAPQPPSASFMDLVREVRINELVVTAFEGRRMELEPFVSFDTAAHPQSGEAMKVSIDHGVFRPAHAEEPTFLALAGHIDGEIENGQMEFEKNKCVVTRGSVREGAFQAESGEHGRLATSFSAKSLFFELSSGDFVVPGGMGVSLDEGSTFEVADAKVSAAGHFSGVAKLDLTGKTGRVSRRGATISASNIHLKTPGLTILDGRATGPLELSFDYQLRYPFVVKYPIPEIAEKKLMLDFHGPFATTLMLSDAGGDEGEVIGDYLFKAPWPPIEEAALVVLAAKWQQDVAIKKVDFTIAPKMFRPCGISCFILGFEFTAEKRSGKKRLFSQFCAPVGKAELFVDKAARAFVLKDVRVETHCKGVVGWVVNFVAPLFAKTYSDTVLFQMPADLPMTIDSVRGGAEWIEIGGKIEWEAGNSKSQVSSLRSQVGAPPDTWNLRPETGD